MNEISQQLVHAERDRDRSRDTQRETEIERDKEGR